MKKSIYTLAIVSILSVLPVFVFAMNETSVSVSNNYSNYSVEKLEALIVQLQKQLDELKKNVAPCSLADVDLSLGDGEDDTSKIHVKNFQNFLKEKGYISKYQTATGYFGKITRNAVINFQKDLGLEQTGELNSTLRSKIATLKCLGKYISVTKNETATVPAGAVTAITASGSGANISWTTNGYSKNGFKIVWSKNTTPTYPTRERDKYIYLSEPSATNTTLDAFDGSGTYYVRVCEYLGGSCGLYSNQVSVNL